MYQICLNVCISTHQKKYPLRFEKSFGTSTKTSTMICLCSLSLAINTHLPTQKNEGLNCTNVFTCLYIDHEQCPLRLDRSFRGSANKTSIKQRDAFATSHLSHLPSILINQPKRMEGCTVPNVFTSLYIRNNG